MTFNLSKKNPKTMKKKIIKTYTPAITLHNLVSQGKLVNMSKYPGLTSGPLYSIFYYLIKSNALFCLTKAFLDDLSCFS